MVYGSEQVGQQGPWYQWKSQGGSAAEEDEIGRAQRVGMSSGLACTGSRIGLTIPGSGIKCGSEVQDSGPYGMKVHHASSMKPKRTTMAMVQKCGDYEYHVISHEFA